MDTGGDQIGVSRILKWPVPVDDKPHEIGGGPVVLVASPRGRVDELQIWTLEYNGVNRTRNVQVYGTGMELPIFAKPLGSVVLSAGNLVWHVVSVHGPEKVN